MLISTASLADDEVKISGELFCNQQRTILTSSFDRLLLSSCIISVHVYRLLGVVKQCRGCYPEGKYYGLPGQQ